mgnify:CR=1 FL=1
MNDLSITKELKQVNFKYVSNNLTFEGTCDVTSEKKVENINASVSVKVGEMDTNIGNVSNNGSVSVNIWNTEYKNMVDVVAAALKSMATDLANYYNVQSNSEIV